MKKIIAVLLVMSLFACSTQRGSAWGPDPYETAGKILIMLPISILLSPLYIPQAIIENAKKDKRYDNQSVYKTEEMIISTKFYRLKEDQYSLPSIYIENGNNEYNAFIPVYNKEIQEKANVEKLKVKYQKSFSILVNNVRKSEIKSSWRAYQYKNKDWLVFDSRCNILGISTEKELLLLSRDKIDQEMWDLRGLCQNNGVESNTNWNQFKN